MDRRPEPPEEIGDPVAVRTFVVLGDPPRQISVVIGKPRRHEGSEDYSCPYHVGGLGNGKSSFAVGIDGVQALQLAMRAIGALLYLSPEGKKGLLRWEGDDAGDLGFPRP